MIQVIKKSNQFNTTIFNGRFIVNKPVAHGIKANLQPYSNLFYWSHAIAVGDCEFGLHPHEGFEIMTFVLDGNISHYDTETRVWTSLKAGDFQVIQSNRGIQHQEKVAKGTRAFQIWFDPNYYQALDKQPSYVDYHQEQLPNKEQDGISLIEYVGGSSQAITMTEGLAIKKISFKAGSAFTMSLEMESTYSFYLLSGQAKLDNHELSENDFVKVEQLEKIEIVAKSTTELFVMQTPTKSSYKPVWNND